MADCLEELLPHLSRFGAVVIGPGLGRDAGAGEFLTAFATAFARHFSQEMGKAWAPPCVYDADARFPLAQSPGLLAELPANAVLTPHPGEMARILGMGMGELQADRPSAARRFCKTHPQVLALKGAGTLVAQGGCCACAPSPLPIWRWAAPATCWPASWPPVWRAASSRSPPPAWPCTGTPCADADWKRISPSGATCPRRSPIPCHSSSRSDTSC